MLKVSLVIVLCVFSRVSPAPAQETINFSFSAVTPTQAGVWMAEETGAFKRNGLDVKLVYIPSGSTSMQALLGGSLEAAHAGSSAVIVAAAQGAPVVAIAAPQNRPVYTLWVQPEIQRIEELKGKVLGFTRFNSSTHFVTVLVLKKYGLERDVQVRPMGGVPEMLSAFSRRQVAGVVTANPPEAKARNLLNVADLGIPYATGVIATTRDYLRNRRPTLKRLLRAYSEGVAEIFHQRDKTIAILGKYLRRGDEKALGEIYDQLRNYVERVPRVDPRVVESVLSVLGKESAGGADSVIDNGVVEELVGEKLYARLYGKEVR
jgi:ABC-type nitrate/sulfonate/bicarbonate transport system substrate-binding protein